MIIGIDFESWYSDEYSLGKMPTHQYIRDARWKCLGCGFQFGDEPPFYIEDPEPIFRKIDAYGWENVILVAHNAGFDGSVLWERYGQRRPGQWLDTQLIARWAIAQGRMPPEQGVSLAKLAPLVGMRKGNTWDAVHGGGQHLADYGTEDVRIMMALLQLFMRWNPPREELEYMDMHIRMSTEPVLQTDRAMLEEAATITPQMVELNKLLRKDANMVQLLEAHGVEVGYKTTPKGKRKPALAKTDAFMQGLLQHENDKVAQLASLRLGANSNITRTRALTMLGVGNPLPFPVLYYGAGTGRASGLDGYNCFSAGHELLTPEGWVAVEAYREGTPIMQWWPDGRMSWEEVPQFLAKRHRGEMIVLESGTVSLRVTPDHRMVGMQRGRAVERTAQQVLDRGRLDGVPLAGSLIGGTEHALGTDRVRLMVAVAADGCESKGAIVFGFHKARKAERLRVLLNCAEVRYTETRYGPRYHFRVLAGQLEKTEFGPWVLSLPAEERKALLDELPHWDGMRHQKNGATIFYSSILEQAEWVVTLARVSGVSATLYAYPKGSGGTSYHVYFRSSTYTTLDVRRHRFELEGGADEVVYCPSVSSSYVLVRRRGKVCVAGQCQNMPAGGVLRQAISAGDGYKLVVGDSGQIEARVVGWSAGEERLLEIFREADASQNPGRDAYRLFGGQYMYHMPPERLTDEQRKIAKAGLLGLGFGQGWRGLKEGARAKAGLIMSEEDAQAATTAYREGFARVPQWWRRLKRWALEDGYLELPDGRRLLYPDMREEERENREGALELMTVYDRPLIFSKGPRGKRQTVKFWHGLCAENVVQATARSVVFWQAMQMRKEGIPVLGMSHDEVISRAREDEAADVADRMQYWFRQVPPWAEGLPVNGSVVIGDDYASCK